MLLFAQPAASQQRGANAQRQDVNALAEQLGGVYNGPQARYVEAVGERMAAASGMAGQCTFTLVNTDVVNAFAVPSCHVFITRGLLSIMNSEDELAFVMGHEVGHMAARHSQKRQNRSLLTGLGAMIIGAVTKDERIGELLGQGAQLHTLSFSRAQEYEADDLGVRYLVAAGYAPQASTEMLRALQRSDAMIARTRAANDSASVPEWARTHPLTSERVTRTATVAARTTGAAPGAAPRQDPYFSAVDGMLFGDDPAQGYILGRTFAHPQMQIAFDAPSGFTMTNSTRAVLITGPSGAKAQFAGGQMQGGSLERHAGAVLAQLAGQSSVQTGRAQHTTVNGIPAVVLAARANTQGGRADLTVVAYEFGPQTAYHFIGIAPAGAGRVLDPLFGSFRRISQGEAASLRPRRIEVVPVRSGDSVASLIQRMEIENPHEWFAVLNNVSSQSVLPPGQRVKLVTYDRRRR